MRTVPKILQEQGLSAEVIGERCRLPIDRVKDLMSGVSPTVMELRALARGLRLSLSEFSRRDRNDDTELALLFRRSLPQRAIGSPSIEFIREYVEGALSVLPARSDYPAWLTNIGDVPETYEGAEALAEYLRNVLGVADDFSPILNLGERLGGVESVVLGVIRQSQFEGVSFLCGGYCFIFVSARFSGRMLFTAAHEFAHVGAHHLASGVGKFERASQVGNARIVDKGERFADAFASCLLMPQRGLALALKEIRSQHEIQSESIGDIEISLLARIFGVSFEVAARRCETFDLLPVGGAKSLVQEIVKNFGSPENRARQLGLPRRPTVEFPLISRNLLWSIFAKVESGEISLGWAAGKFDVSIGELTRLHSEYVRAVRH